VYELLRLLVARITRRAAVKVSMLMLQVTVLGTALNTGLEIAHNVRILAARVPSYSRFLNVSSFIVLLAVSTSSVFGDSCCAWQQRTLMYEQVAAVYAP
jgi:hypothetical protein